MAETAEVLGDELRVDECVAAHTQFRREVDECALLLCCAAEHAFAKKDTFQRNTIQPPTNRHPANIRHYGRDL